MRCPLLHGSVTLGLAAGGLLWLVQDPPPAPAPAPRPGPAAPAQDPGKGGSEPAAGERTPPLAIAELDILLLRAQRNLRLHGLSFVPTTLQWAVRDYRAAVKGLPDDADADRRFSALFSLAFALSLTESPADAAGREAHARETFDMLDRASRVDSAATGPFAGHPGLWIVDGIMREQMGEFAVAEKQITTGFARLGEYSGLQPWQDDQLRLFGLLARGRALLQPPLNSGHLALKDFLEAQALAEKFLEDPLAPRTNRLRPVVLTHLAAAHQDQDNFDLAEKILEELVRTDPGNATHLYNMALVKATQQKFTEALQWYRKYATFDRLDPKPHIKIAFILLLYPEPGREPDTAEALREGEIFLLLQGGEPGAEYCCVRGESAFLRREMKDAESWFRKALAIDPRCRTALQRMMNILGQKEDPTDAVKEEMERIRKRLLDSKDKDSDGPGMDNKRKKRSDLTFC